MRGRLHRGTLPSLILATWALGPLPGAAREPPSPPADAPPMFKLAETHAAAGEAFRPKKRQKDGDCQLRYRLPDPRCTPGAVMAIDFDTLCHQPAHLRARIAPALEKKVLADYGHLSSHGQEELQLDHLIPLSLGGDNTIENLWPQPSKPSPGFHEKNYAEAYLHDKVCSGEMTLAEAQRQIATDWLSVWLKISRGTGDDGQAR